MSPPSTNLVGGIEIAIVLAVFLHGMVTVQAYVYSRSFPHDSKLLKSMVALIWIADIGHVCCGASGIYTITIGDYGLSLYRIALPTSFTVAAGFGVVVHHLVQITSIFYIYKLSRQLYLTLLCSMIAVFNIAGNIMFICTVLLFSRTLTMQVMERYEEKWNYLIISVFSSTAALDVIIAISLCYFLLKQYRAALENTAHLIDKLLSYAIQTGLLTSLASIAVVICFVTMRSNNAWFAIWMASTSLYPNSILAMLNGRLELADSEPTTLSTVHISRETHTFGDSNFMSRAESDFGTHCSKGQPSILSAGNVHDDKIASIVRLSVP